MLINVNILKSVDNMQCYDKCNTFYNNNNNNNNNNNDNNNNNYNNKYYSYTKTPKGILTLKFDSVLYSNVFVNHATHEINKVFCMMNDANITFCFYQIS